MNDHNGNGNRKESWGTRMGVILAVTGSAVGLGNFIRFPGLASQYNAGAFMIPYIIALLLLGLPIAWAEWSMGRYGGVRGFNSCPGIFRVIWRSKFAPFFGVLGILVPVMIYMYYVFIESWCLGYAWHYLAGDMEALGHDKAAYSDFFTSYVGLDQNGALFHSGWTVALTCLLICVVLNFTLIYRGLSKGIEWFCLRAMPLLVILAIIILIRVLTLGTPDPSKPDLNVVNALGFMWNPGTWPEFWTALQNPEMWLAAAGQIFFSLSVGFGVIITYSSYLKKDDDIALSSTTAVAGNEFCEVSLGGMIVIPAAFIFLGAADTAAAAKGGSLFTLGFKTLPMIFDYMPAGGRWFGFLFFFLLFLAAVTSSLSMLQPAIAFLEEGLGITRKGSVALLGFITLSGTAFIVYFSEGAAALDTIDFWVGTFCIYVLATLQVILFGWVLGTDKGMKELGTGATLQIPKWVRYIIKYVSPVYLLAIFIVWISNKEMIGKRWEAIQENVVVFLSIGFIVLVAATFLLLIGEASSKWDKSAPLEKIKS